MTDDDRLNGNATSPENEKSADKHKEKKRNPLLRITLKTLFWVLVVVLMIPVIIYIPPVQTMLKNMACNIVSETTGMTISIERFRLSFPIDVALDGVVVVEASGDTMVKADEAIVGVKLKPLFNSELQLKMLKLRKGSYRMVSADSSMILKAQIGNLVVDGNTGMNLETSEINLDRAELQNGNISLYMNVWKAKKEPKDTTSLPFLINVKDVEVENINFAMSMLPTIDSLDASLGKIALKNAVVDLRTNKIFAQEISADGGDVRYIVPTTDYLATHQVPADTMQEVASEPMTIQGENISITNINALYAVKGATPIKGFDSNYIAVSGLVVGIKDFFNKGSELRVPIKEFAVKERCGLNVTRGEGVVGLDSLGISIDNFLLETTNSRIDVDGYVSFGMMSMQRHSPVNLEAHASVGFDDMVQFMPSLSKMLVGVSQSRRAELVMDVDGSLSSLDIGVLSLSVPNFVSLASKGYVNNLHNIKQIKGELDINGNLATTSYMEQFVEGSGISVPSMRIVGHASVESDNYNANLQMLTPSGDLTFDGGINLKNEGYRADLNISEINLSDIMPGLGIGLLSGNIVAEGDGFDIMNPETDATIRADIFQLEYEGRSFGNLETELSLHNGEVEAKLISYDPYCDVDMHIDGALKNDSYEFKVVANVINVDLQELGFSETMNSGSGELSFTGWAKPMDWLYDVDIRLENFNWNLPGQYIHLPNGLKAEFDAREDDVNLDISADLLNLHYNSPCGLDSMVNRFIAATDTIMVDMQANQFNVRRFQPLLPKFDLMLNARGTGLVKQFLDVADIKMDSIAVGLRNDGKILGDLGLYKLKVGTMRLDTITFALSERSRVIDYRLHIGNRKGTLDEFASVDLKGYFGGNRASVLLCQQNINGQTGYRLGLTAALLDDVISLHFTPLDAKIAYMPWTFNEDNHLEYNFDGRVDANLLASSDDSQVKLKTVSDDEGNNVLNVNIENLKIQDFLKLSVFAPPITGSFNSDMSLKYKGNAVLGSGTLNVTDMTYDRSRLGTFVFNFKAGLDMAGNTGAMLSLMLDNEEVMTGKGYLVHDSITMKSRSKIGLTLNKFPMSLANPFLGNDLASLNGALNGSLEMTGELIEPRLNGDIRFSAGEIYLPMMGTTLRMDTIPVTVVNNMVEMKQFKIWAANENPVVIDGVVDARDITKIGVDMGLSAKNVQLVGGKKKSRSDIYGKLFTDMTASVKGDLNALDINANMSVLAATDVSYTMQDAESVISAQTNGEVVKFVVLADSVENVAKDTVPSAMNMKIAANLNIVKGAKVTVNLSANGTDKVEIYPSGNLVYSQNYMGDIRLNGQLNVHDGFVRYNVPIMGEKKFSFEPNSYVLWNGDMLNPTLNFLAIDKVKTNVKQDNQNSRVVNFDISLSLTNTLSNPKILFDLSTEDDIAVQNELQSMSADQRSNQAMNLLLYNTYTGSSGSSSVNFSAEGQLYSFLTSQLNSWAAKTVQGVDLSFGIDQYNQTIDGQNSSSMSYSYQVSKSLFDNKFKIVVGGNYTTDASVDENFAQNLISDISFEYTIKQTNNLSMYAKLFRHTGYESILEGEITETGVGFVMKRRLDNLKSLFRFRLPKFLQQKDTVPSDTIVPITKEITNPLDSLDGFDVEPINEGYDVLN